MHGRGMSTTKCLKFLLGDSQMTGSHEREPGPGGGGGGEKTLEKEVF